MKFSTSVALLLSSSTTLSHGALRGVDELSGEPLWSRKLSTCGDSSCVTGGANGSYRATSNGGGIAIDGDASDWSDKKSCSIPMFNAGNSAKTNAGNAYVDYHCETSTTCILVELEPGYTVDTTEDGMKQMWFKVYKEATSEFPGNIAMVSDENDIATGWEGCFTGLAAGCIGDVQIHMNYNDPVDPEGGNTLSTGKKDNAISLDLSCLCSSSTQCGSGCTSASTCEEGKCVYQVDNSCCEDDDDCDSGQTCDKGSSTEATTGTCKEDEDVTCNTDTDCFVGSTKSQDCTTAVCQEGGLTCSFSEKNVQPESCGTLDPAENGNSCYTGNECDGMDCVPVFLSAGDNCEGTPSSPCMQMKCQSSGDGSKTTCQEVPKAAGTLCSTPGDRGICDDGDKCDASGNCIENGSGSYAVGDECRASVGCCDKPDVCAVGSYDCPADGKYGPDHTCRPVCEFCDGDVAEVCDGTSDKCPDNIILEDSLCIKAGQHNDAGEVKIVATEYSDGTVDVCFTVSFTSPWTLVSEEDESLKAYFSTEGPPSSNSGHYGIKVSTSEFLTNGFHHCVDLPNKDTSLYFAIHFDTTNGSDQETAWVMDCGDEENPHSSQILSSRFTETKRGATVYSGWGEKHVLTPCNNSGCSKDCPGPDGAGSPTDAPSATPETSWSCQDQDDASNTVSMTCAVGDSPDCA